MLHEVKLETLHKFDDGRVAVAFDQAFARLLADCIDRPNVGEARVLKLLVSLKPDPNGDAGDAVDVSFKLNDGMPARSTRNYSCAVRRKGQKQLMLVYNDLSDYDARQQSLPLDGEE